MSSNSILGPTGQNWVALGGERSWGQQRVKGDICCSFQWLEMPGFDDPHPCMVLFPTVMKLDGGAYAIPQDNAYQYARRDGSPTPHLMASAVKAAMQMGFFPDQSTVFRIIDIIMDSLPDLVKMPSTQPGEFNLQRIVHGIEATAKVGGRVVHQEVI